MTDAGTKFRDLTDSEEQAHVSNAQDLRSNESNKSNEQRMLK